MINYNMIHIDQSGAPFHLYANKSEQINEVFSLFIIHSNVIGISSCYKLGCICYRQNRFINCILKLFYSVNSKISFVNKVHFLCIVMEYNSKCSQLRSPLHPLPQKPTGIC